MIEPQPELSRPIEISRIPPTGSTETIIAEPKEREPIARRLGLPAVHALKADLALSRWRGEGVKVTGRVAAEVEQICVVTLDPFRAEVTDTVERYFLPGADSANEEANVDSFDNGIIELGEVVVESLSLALDPYPRKPGAEFHVAGDDATAAAGEATPSPFAALSGLEPRKR